MQNESVSLQNTQLSSRCMTVGFGVRQTETPKSVSQQTTYKNDQ